MSESNRLLLLRLTALGLAILLWLFVTVERREERPSEKVVDATVTYNPPPGMIILDPQERVRVRLRGSARAIRRVNPFQIDVQVVVTASRSGPVQVQLQPENVMAPEGVEVVSIEPNALRLHLDEEQQRLLPVEVPLIGEPAAGSRVAGAVRVVPDKVLVSGPRKLVAALKSIRSNSISLDGHAFDFQESSLLVAPDPLLQLQTQVVSVFVPMRQPPAVVEATPTPKPTKTGAKPGKPPAKPKRKP